MDLPFTSCLMWCTAYMRNVPEAESVNMPLHLLLFFSRRPILLYLFLYHINFISMHAIVHSQSTNILLVILQGHRDICSLSGMVIRKYPKQKRTKYMSGLSPLSTKLPAGRRFRPAIQFGNFFFIIELVGVGGEVG